jgi:hypothetical protein
MADATFYRVAERRSRAADAGLIFLALAPLVMLLVASYHWEMMPLPMAALIVVVSAVFVGTSIWSQARYAETAVLRVDDLGMQLRSGAPRLFANAFQRPWSVAWKEVAQVVVMERMGMIQVRKRGFTALPIVLRGRDWVPQDASHDSRPPRDMRGSPLWKDLESRGFFRLHGASKAQPVDFDLMQHPATRSMLVVMAVLAGYWLTENFTAREAWAEWNARYLAPHFAIAAAAAVLGFVWLRLGKGPTAVPAQVLMFMAVLLGATAGLASWSGLLRVNQFAGGPIVEEAYVRNKECDRLLPRKAGLPEIEYTELARGYWCQFGLDHVHYVRIRRGIGGLYQVDLSPHTRKIREFRRRA